MGYRRHAERGQTQVSAAVVAVIPAFNEERAIGDVVASAKRFVDMVLVVDDGSVDRTAAMSEHAGAVVIRHDRNVGKASAIDTGLRWARDRSVSALVLLDGDGQHDSFDVPRLLDPILRGGSDVVVGSRFLDIRNPTPFYRVVGQRVLNVATRLGSGQPCSDSQSGYRALSARAIQAIRLRERFLSGLAAESEMQFEIAEHRLRLREIPICVRYDERPRRSPVKHGFGVLYRVIVLTLRRRLLAEGLARKRFARLAAMWAGAFGRRV